MAEPVKVLVVGSSQGVHGGIEAFMVAVAEDLAQRDGFEVELCFKIVTGFDLKQSLKDLVQHLTIPVVFTRRGRSELMQAMRRADAIHCQNAPPDIVFPAKLFGRPVLATIHNCRYDAKTLNSRIRWFGSRFVAIRTFNSAYVRTFWDNGPEGDRSLVVPAVSSMPVGEPTSVSSRSGFCFVSRMIPHKGGDLLLEAYLESGLNSIEHPLVLMGDGPLRESLEKRAAESGLPGIKITGHVTEQEKYDYISQSRWLVAPPDMPEDMGLTPIEARQFGVPSIIANHGGLPEAGGPAAIKVEPGNRNALAQALREASQMDNEEYTERANLARNSLADYLRPIGFYGDQLAALVNQKR
ncbi:MAG: glycosyltransferase family 4 protein [Verrucomicrobiota bacterium]